MAQSPAHNHFRCSENPNPGSWASGLRDHLIDSVSTPLSFAKAENLVNDSNDPADPCWDQVVDEHARRVFAIAMRILGSVHEAEDAAQEAFVQALEFHKRKRVENWTGLLVRLATTRSLDRLRRKKAHVPLRETDRIAQPDPAEGMITDELRAQLLNAWIQLPDQQASVFWMIAIEQLSREEVSMALGISCEAVSTALYKARNTLAREMSGIQIGGKS